MNVALPLPEDTAERARIEEQARRYRMLEGEWQQDADDRYSSLFHPMVRALLPAADTAQNPFLALSLQQAVIYDEDPVVHVDPKSGYPEALELDSIITEDCWPLMVDASIGVIGMHELVLYTTWTEGRGISYEVVPPHLIRDVEPDPTAPDQALSLTRLRWRRHPTSGEWEWTYEVWQPASLTFRIEAMRATASGREQRVDVTADYVKDWDGKYPRIDLDGRGIMPFVIYHDRIRSKPWAPYGGREVVSGTLTAASLNTMWLMGVRDSSHPQRYVLNARAQGVGQSIPTDGQQVSYIPGMPGMVLQFSSTAGQQVTFGQWAAAIDPRALRESIGAYVQELAIYAGISPSDLQVTSGQSGYAIALTRDGQRKAQRRLMPAFRRSDRLRLATAARMHNSAVGRREMPEAATAYRITYPGLDQTPEEVKADQDEAMALREAGVLSPVAHYQRVHPEATDTEALAALLEAARQEAQLAAIRDGTAAQVAVPVPEDEDTDDAPTGEPEGATVMPADGGVTI